MGARLMEIRTQEEYDSAVGFSQEFSAYFWLGGSDLQVDGNWVWESNREGVDMNEFWYSGMPRDRNDLNCLGMDSFGMYDWYCHLGYNSVCEHD